MSKQSPYLIEPSSKVNLSKLPTADTGNFSSEGFAAPVLEKYRAQLSKLQEILYAGQQQAVLIVLQAMDAGGKDGTISHIFSGVNPQGCVVSSFKVPTPLESRHDFLWRAHQAVPPRGIIGIFNRSHYEDVLSPRVHKLVSPGTVQQHLVDIVDFERTLHHSGVLILKFFLHISRAEQKSRLQERLDDPDKHWKLAQSDFQERKFWSRYQAAYEDLISYTSRKHAPWFVIPADHKWYRNVVISSILVGAMDSLKLSYPKPTFDPSTVKL